MLQITAGHSCPGQGWAPRLGTTGGTAIRCLENPNVRKEPAPRRVLPVTTHTSPTCAELPDVSRGTDISFCCCSGI